MSCSLKSRSLFLPGFVTMRHLQVQDWVRLYRLPLHQRHLNLMASLFNSLNNTQGYKYQYYKIKISFWKKKISIRENTGGQHLFPASFFPDNAEIFLSQYFYLSHSVQVLQRKLNASLATKELIINVLRIRHENPLKKRNEM